MKRIYHIWSKWECYPAGFYENKPKDKTLSDEDCRNIYTEFLRDREAFEFALKSIIEKWPNSCEHYLTNENMNRIAWLGQASLCYAKGIPSYFRGGFIQLSEREQNCANRVALKYLNIWLIAHGEKEISLAEAQSKTDANLY